MAETSEVNAIISGRLCFPSLDTPTAPNGEGEPRYRATILIPKDDKETINTLKKIAKAAFIERFGNDAWERKQSGWSGINDGDTRSKGPDGVHDGCFYINCKSKNKPFTVDEYREPTTKVYAGCYVNVLLYAYGWEYAGKRGISYAFSGLQFVKDGAKIESSGTRNAIEQFPILAKPVSTSSVEETAPVTLEDFDDGL